MLLSKHYGEPVRYATEEDAKGLLKKSSRLVSLFGIKSVNTP